MSAHILRAAAAALLIPVLIPLLGERAAAQERVFVRPEPGTPLVAVQVLVGVGPADEAAAQAGISYLAARSVVEPSRATFDSLGAHLDVDQQKDAIAFTLTAAPDAWEEATRVLMVALFAIFVAAERRARVPGRDDSIGPGHGQTGLVTTAQGRS